MKIKGKYVTHPGSNDAMLAGVRGDVDWVQSTTSDLRKLAIDSNDLTPVVVYATDRLKDLPNVPTIGELGYPELADYIKVNYLVGGTPGIPMDVLKILQDAFQKTVKDPDFIKAMETSGDKLNPGTAEDSKKVMDEALKGYAKYKDLILQYQK